MLAQVNEADTEQHILQRMLSDGSWSSACDIFQRLSCSLSGASKVSVNQTLYELLREGKVECTNSTPPLWRLAPKTPQERLAFSTEGCQFSQENLICMIDLGNTHDCLRPLETYAAMNMLTVFAYADLAYAGYGVNPRVFKDNVNIFQADTPDKNSADVQIIWDTCRIVQKEEERQGKRALHILIASKDLGFLRLKHLVEKNPLHKLTFVRNWPEMRCYVE